MKFEIYRYQLLPIMQQQFSLFDVKLSPDELREQKNQLMEEVLSSITLWKSVKSYLDLASEVLYNNNNWYIFRLARKKDLKRSTRNFLEEEIDDWPQVIVLINNEPSTQAICVSVNKKAFTNTAQVIKIIEENIVDLLSERGLSIQINPTFYKNDFWKMIDESKGDIYSLKFEFISPNMSNLHKSVILDLKSARDRYNSQRTSVEFSVDKNIENASINVDPSDSEIQNMVDYVSEGCGDIYLKRRKIKSTLNMKNNIRILEVEEDFDSKQRGFWSNLQKIYQNLKRVIK